MDRNDVVELIVRNRIEKGLTWQEIGVELGASKEWVTAGCLGQMTFTKLQSEKLTNLLGLPAEAVHILQTPAYRGSLPTAVPTDPLVYMFYELVSVYGSTLKALIHEEFGDGIMSAIDFSMDLQREKNDAGDRVRIVMSGKFLPYKQY